MRRMRVYSWRHDVGRLGQQQVELGVVGLVGAEILHAPVIRPVHRPQPTSKLHLARLGGLPANVLVVQQQHIIALRVSDLAQRHRQMPAHAETGLAQRVRLE